MPWPLRPSGPVLAGVFALWSTAFLWPQLSPALAVLPVGFGVGGWLVVRHVATGALVVAATQAAGLVLGAPVENAAGLLPAICCLFLAGRRLSPARGGCVLVGYVAIVAASGFGVSRALVGVLLFTGTWLVGQVVGEGAAVVQARRAVARDLELRDHEATAAQVVDRERGRILSGSLDIVEQAVSSMRADAEAAAQSLDPRLLDRVGSRGEAAIADLRRILGLLRTPVVAREPVLDEALLRFVTSDDPLPADVERRGAWRTDALLAVALAAVGLAEAVGHSLEPAATGLAAAVPLGLALWRTSPALAATVCAVPMAVALAADVPVPHGVVEMVTIAMLAWAAAGAAAERPGLGPRVLVALPAGMVVILSAIGTGPSPTLSLVPVVVAAVAAVAVWTRRRTQHAESEADSRISRAQARLRSSVDDAMAAERLRIARELHDITSHAVGAMVLQARAARALAGRDPVAARRAVDNALTAGDQAMKDLGELAEMLRDDLHRSDPEDLQGLVDRLGTTGLEIELEGHLPDDPEIAFTVHRIVQEALANAARYAPGAWVRVRLVEEPDRVRVLVQDGGGRHQAAAPSGTGFGLDGLAERVRLQGGQLNAGPEGRGFRVSAVLPTSPAPPASGPVEATPMMTAPPPASDRTGQASQAGQTREATRP